MSSVENPFVEEVDVLASNSIEPNDPEPIEEAEDEDDFDFEDEDEEEDDEYEDHSHGFQGSNLVM